MTNKKIKNKRIFKKIALSFLVFCFVGGFLYFININKVYANPAGLAAGVDVMDPNAISTADSGVKKGILAQTWEDIANWAKQFATTKFYEDIWKKVGAQALQSAISNALNTIAYDTATWIGSGGKGQKPLFVTESVGEYLANIGDNAAGKFIESIGRSWDFNLCEPDLELKIKIGLGLMRQERPEAPACTFTKMLDNWEKELQSGDFLNKFQDMFEPTSNDLGIALSLQTGMMDEIDLAGKLGLEKLQLNKGWLSVEGIISGWKKLPPNEEERRLEQVRALQSGNILKYTGHALTDAVNVFINQLAITLFNRLMEKDYESYTSPYGGDYGLSDYEAGPSRGGAKAAKEKFRELTEPKFDIRGDYNILGELTMCSEPTKAGPTNCVIEEQFRQAIENKLTVGQAMEQGYLNKDGIFGFTTGENLEPDYKDLNYPYRSIIILRKFRILPVGWELAAQYIRDNKEDIGEVKNLEDLVNCYDSNDTTNDVWCKGLVDPDWVLKAPLNYCKREGPGPIIMLEQVTGEGSDSELFITRDDTYCADEQTCIKEASDGSCEVYGYCTEDRRAWNFGSDSCNPQYNTCQTFRKKSEGSTYSFLENTLDFCDSEGAGCKKYAVAPIYSEANYATTTDTVTWVNSSENKYFNGSVEKCGAGEEGCHEFIRTKAGLGANLLSDDIDTILAGNPYELEIKTSVGIEYEIASSTFTLSFDAKNCESGSEFWLGESADISGESDFEVEDSWQRFYISYIYLPGYTGNKVKFKIIKEGDDCEVDNIKLERGDTPTAYSAYREQGLIYEKLIPKYLGGENRMSGACFEDSDSDDFMEVIAGAPSKCDDFVRFCNKKEVDCELYTSAKDNYSIPAKVTAFDYCPGECVGYDTFIQSKTVFDSSRYNYFIPSTAKTCGAGVAGCDEFTNLDKVELEGEEREYYLYLRQCKKPNASCDDFYTWEGSNETGFQLKVFNLWDNNNNNEPDVTEYDGEECSQAIYELPATDPKYNSDCREFYNRDGEISWHLYTRTISCTENCHPYRRTEKNITTINECKDECKKGKNACDSTCTACQNNCESKDCSKAESDGLQSCKYEGSDSSVFCKSNGYWDSEHYACIYDAVPGEGTSCSQSSAGCREYNGNEGANMRILFTDDFESGDTQDWEGDLNSENNPSNESIKVGGHSLFIEDEDGNGKYKIYNTIGNLVQKNKSYVLKFIAKSLTGGASKFSDNGIGFGTSTIAIDIPFSLSSPELVDEWRLYEFNLARLNNEEGNYEIASTTKLFIQTDGSFYIDDIRLTEITDRYYLIKNSWVTPVACDNKLDDPVGENCSSEVEYPRCYPQEMLECEKYTDREGSAHNLHSFAYLCSESAVGCELMIDTYNSSSTLDTDCSDEDSFEFVVYNDGAQCSAGDKGCDRFGETSEYEEEAIYRDIYLIDDPDKCDEVGCEESQVGCEEWTSPDGTVYFYDPGDMVCEYRQLYGTSTAEGWGWFKYGKKRCNGGSEGYCLTNSDCNTGDAVTCADDEACRGNTCVEDGENNKCSVTGEICSDNDDCELLNSCVSGECNYACVIDKNDAECATDLGSDEPQPPKTLGIGGLGNRIEQPSEWVGLCPASEAGCTEYIDPVSKFSINLLGEYTANALIEPYTLYIQEEVDIDCPQLYNLDVGSNELTSGNGRFPYNTYTDTDEECSASGAAGSMLRKAVIDYQLKQNVDKTTCNGVVNFDEGCVLFNERLISGGDGYAKLKFNASSTPDGQAPSSEPPLDANTLLKVFPDRVCNQWLACRSFIKDEDNNNVCFDIGLCDNLDENGNCSNFLVATTTNQTYSYESDKNKAGDISNLSGYVKVGYLNNSTKSDYLLLGAMKQVGQVANLTNGGFEFYGSNGYPLGWNATRYNSQHKLESVPWTEGMFSAVNNPISAQIEGIDYPVEGKSFLKFSPSNCIMSSEFIEVEPEAKYILSGLINTTNFHPGSGFRNIVVSVNIGTYQKDGSPAVSHYDNSTNDLVKCSDSVDGQPWRNGCGIGMAAGNDWTIMKKSFEVGEHTYKIKLNISGQAYQGEGGCCDLNNNGVCPEIAAGEYNYAPNMNCNDVGTAERNYCGGLPGHDEIITINNDTCAGNVYFDDIKLTPVLNNRDDSDISQTCRLYPQDDSMSCEYYEDSGKKQNGLKGYCLEYDRYPGSEDACLMWYPIDKVRGEGIEEGAGYSDRFPLYYCLDVASTTPVEYRKNYDHASDLGCDRDGQCSITHIPGIGGSYAEVVVGASCNSGCGADCNDGENIYKHKLTPMGKCWADENGEPCDSGDDGWYEYDGSLVDHIDTATYPIDSCGGCPACVCDSATCAVIDETEYGLKYVYKPTGEVIDAPVYCTELVQTVTSLGQNKYWSGRVYEGSNYAFECNIDKYGKKIPGRSNICKYLSDYSPFGAMVPPSNSWSIISNPYEWDSREGYDGNQPLFHEKPDEKAWDPPYQVRMGQLVNATTTKRLFAESYGFWEWQEGYICADGNFCEGQNGLAVDPDDCKNDDCNDGYCEDIERAGSGGKRGVCSVGGVCDLNGNYPCPGSHHVFTGIYMPKASSEMWGPPEDLCTNGVRPVASTTAFGICYEKDAGGTLTGSYGSCSDCPGSYCDFCYIYPKVENVKVNGQTGDDITITIKKNGFINLTFNSQVDSQQLPLIMYYIEWGDGEYTIVSGVEMNDRINPDEPHSLYHLYSYWDMVGKKLESCLDGTCSVSPKIKKIRDNWGNDSAPVSFSGSIEITE